MSTAANVHCCSETFLAYIFYCVYLLDRLLNSLNSFKSLIIFDEFFNELMREKFRSRKMQKVKGVKIKVTQRVKTVQQKFCIRQTRFQ